MCALGEFPGARRGEENPAEPRAGTEASPQPRGTEGSIGFGRVEAERASLGERREAGTCYRTSGMSWKSALESSVPMERAMKNVRTRRKNAFWVHGTMKSPSREATLIIDTLRKPKPQTAEREETRARHYRGSRRGVDGEGPEPPPRAGWVGRARAGLRAPEQLSLLLRMLPLRHKPWVLVRGWGKTKPPPTCPASELLGKGFPGIVGGGKNECGAAPGGGWRPALEQQVPKLPSSPRGARGDAPFLELPRGTALRARLRRAPRATGDISEPQSSQLERATGTKPRGDSQLRSRAPKKGKLGHLVSWGSLLTFG